MHLVLDDGQANVLLSALGIAAAAVTPGDDYAGWPEEFLVLRDQVQAQGGGPAGEGARERLTRRGLPEFSRCYDRAAIRQAQDDRYEQPVSAAPHGASAPQNWVTGPAVKRKRAR